MTHQRTIEEAYRQDWMTDDQWKCALMLCDLYRGFHHVNGKIKEWGQGVAVNTHGTGAFASYDFNGLTRSVVMAHDRCIRFAIEPSGPGMLRLILHKRHTREGSMNRRHPTLEEHIAIIRDPAK